VTQNKSDTQLKKKRFHFFYFLNFVLHFQALSPSDPYHLESPSFIIIPMLSQKIPLERVPIHEVDFSSRDDIQHIKLLHHECNPL
jgi:hypothetical protein